VRPARLVAGHGGLDEREASAEFIQVDLPLLKSVLQLLEALLCSS
jgi:hypothetical protein